MGVGESRLNNETEKHFLVPPDGAQCFLCSEFVLDFETLVYWRGPATNRSAYDEDGPWDVGDWTIWFHGHCAIKFGFQLMADGVKIDKFDVVPRGKLELSPTEEERKL
jgi:hypothetical protein